MKEEWRDLEGYKNRYQVSSLGRLRAKARTVIHFDGKVEHRKTKVLKTPVDFNGYPTCLLYDDNGNKKRLTMHRLIAKTFLENPDNKPYVDHINTIRDDNRVCNLRWATPHENSTNPITLSRCRKKGEFHHSEATKKKISEIGKGHITTAETRLKISLANTKHNVFQYRKNGTLIGAYLNVAAAAEHTHISMWNIKSCARGKRKSAGGYLWKREII